MSWGSSPHARGARPTALAAFHSTGLIPACAGSTVRAQSAHGRAWAHPRMRGEHVPRAGRCTACEGSSPHARGARRGSARRISARWAHPRMRGEHGPAGSGKTYTAGSSPHARGALSCGEAVSVEDGLIPACAGSTPTRSTTRAPGRAHPRMRGEHRIRPGDQETYMGSSPHARGALAGHVPGDRCRGLIPACAGSTSARTASLQRVKAHPRMRGEHRQIGTN